MKNFFHLLLITLLTYYVLIRNFSDIEQSHLFIYALNIASLIILVKNIGSHLVFCDFISFSAITLWLSVPLLMIDIGSDKILPEGIFGVGLVIKDAVYINWALPATLGLILGLNMFNYSKEKLEIQIISLKEYLTKNNTNNGHLKLFIIGELALIMSPWVPSFLGFVFFMLSQLTFVAVLYCLFCPSKYNRLIYLGAIFTSLVGVASGGMFGELVWWGMVVAIYFLLKYKIQFIPKLLFVVFGLIFIFLLQNIKGEYRRLTWGKHNEETGNIELLGKTALKTMNYSSTKFFAPTAMLLRANHGHIASMVMKNVPRNEPFANGETVFRALFASFIPRLFWPNKPQSGGQANMVRFAKYDPHGSTSYDIGQIGDAWANFGYYGGIFFLFIYGALNSWGVSKLLHFSANKHPTLFLWIPIIFIQLLKVEGSVETNFNAAVKGFLIVWVVYFFLKKQKVIV